MDNESIRDAFANRAEIETAEDVQCDNCFEQVVFHLRDKNHKFPLGLQTIIECAAFAVRTGDLPKLPMSWLRKIDSIYDMGLAFEEDLCYYDYDNFINKKYKITRDEFLEVTGRKYPFDREPCIDYDKDDVIIDNSVIELYNLLKTQFDRVVYVISRELGVRCSMNFWRKALEQFVKSEAYCYPWLTDANLPYMFAYLGMQHRPLLKQKFRVNSELYKALSACACVRFSDEKDGFSTLTYKDGAFSMLCFRFTGHKQDAESGRVLKESIIFCVDNEDTVPVNTVYEEKIDFDETHFLNIVNKEGNRNTRLLEIAAEVMPELE